MVFVKGEPQTKLLSFLVNPIWGECIQALSCQTFSGPQKRPHRLINLKAFSQKK